MNDQKKRKRTSQKKNDLKKARTTDTSFVSLLVKADLPRFNKEPSQLDEKATGFLPSDFEKFFDNKDVQLYTQRHVFLRDKESDEEEEEKNPKLKLCGVAELQKYLGKGKSIEVVDVNRYSSQVAALLQQFDKAFPGDGGCESGLIFSGPDAIMIPTRVTKMDQLIVQLTGEQNLTILGPTDIEGTAFGLNNDLHNECPEVDEDEDEDEDEDDSKQDHASHDDGCDDDECGGCTFTKVTISEGTIYYLPAGTVYRSVSGSKTSASFQIYFSASLNWQELLNTSLEDTEEDLGLSDDIVEDIVATASSMLIRAQQLLPTTYTRLKARSQLGQSNFFLQTEWKKDLDITKLLKENDGFVRISDFLPLEIAENMLKTIQALKTSEWQISESEDDIESDETAHQFLSADLFPNCRTIFRIFKDLMKDKHSVFSFGKYLKDHYIAEHNDTNVQVIGNGVYKRTIAVVYHLTKDWAVEYGGRFIDESTQKKYVPEFNSLMLFEVPRQHSVEPVSAQAKNPRYSVFGWFLEFEKEADEEFLENHMEGY